MVYVLTHHPILIIGGAVLTNPPEQKFSIQSLLTVTDGILLPVTQYEDSEHYFTSTKPLVLHVESLNSV